MEENKNINRIALLYKDLLSNTVHKLSKEDSDLLLSIKPKNKIIAIGGIDSNNWNSYPLTYLLSNKLVAPTVLSESQIYQSWHAMRVHDDKILHPQYLISQSVIIRIIGLDNSPNINDYINSFISSCIASDECKIIFVIFECDKKTYKNNIYIRKSNSTFIEMSNGKPYIIESTPLCINPDDIVFFNSSNSNVSNKKQTTQKTTTAKRRELISMINDPDMF
jgi:hypothetical protein